MIAARGALVRESVVERRSLREELEQLLGEAGAQALLDECGGRRVYIPQSPRAEDRLSRIVGVEGAERLARIYGGERLELPNPAVRRRRIVSLRRQGTTIEEIARALQCTRRRVFQVLAEERRAASRVRRAGIGVAGRPSTETSD